MSGAPQLPVPRWERWSCWTGQSGRSRQRRHALACHVASIEGEACALHELAHRFMALQMELPRVLPRDRLLGWLDSLPPAVLRAKGVVEFAGEPDRFQFFSRVEEPACFEELPITPPGGRTLALAVGVGLGTDALRRQAEEHFTV